MHLETKLACEIFLPALQESHKSPFHLSLLFQLYPVIVQNRSFQQLSPEDTVIGCYLYTCIVSVYAYTFLLGVFLHTHTLPTPTVLNSSSLQTSLGCNSCLNGNSSEWTSASSLWRDLMTAPKLLFSLVKFTKQLCFLGRKGTEGWETLRQSQVYTCLLIMILAHA